MAPNSERSSKSEVPAGSRPKDVQPVELDDVDRQIVTALHADARMPNSALAELVGIAASTCHGRVRRLQELGVIRGFHADIDPAALGLGLQAMISVSLQSGARSRIRDFIAHMRRLPQVMDVYFLAGADDFILHVAARDTARLETVTATRCVGVVTHQYSHRLVRPQPRKLQRCNGVRVQPTASGLSRPDDEHRSTGSVISRSRVAMRRYSVAGRSTTTLLVRLGPSSNRAITRPSAAVAA